MPVCPVLATKHISLSLHLHDPTSYTKATKFSSTTVAFLDCVDHYKVSRKKQKNVWIFTSVAFPVNVINNLTSDNYEYPLSILSPENNVNYNWSKSLRIKNASHMRKISNSSSPLYFVLTVTVIINSKYSPLSIILQVATNVRSFLVKIDEVAIWPLA